MSNEEVKIFCFFSITVNIIGVPMQTTRPYICLQLVYTIFQKALQWTQHDSGLVDRDHEWVDSNSIVSCGGWWAVRCPMITHLYLSKESLAGWTFLESPCHFLTFNSNKPASWLTKGHWRNQYDLHISQLGQVKISKYRLMGLKLLTSTF